MAYLPPCGNGNTPVRNPFAFVLSTKASCWLDIYKKQLYFHIRSADHQPPANLKYVFLPCGDFGQLGKALRSRVGGRYQLTQYPRRTKAGLLHVVFEVLPQADSTDPQVDAKKPKLIGRLFTNKPNRPDHESRCVIHLSSEEMDVLRLTFNKDIKVDFCSFTY